MELGSQVLDEAGDRLKLNSFFSRPANPSQVLDEAGSTEIYLLFLQDILEKVNQGADWTYCIASAPKDFPQTFTNFHKLSSTLLLLGEKFGERWGKAWGKFRNMEADARYTFGRCLDWWSWDLTSSTKRESH